MLNILAQLGVKAVQAYATAKTQKSDFEKLQDYSIQNPTSDIAKQFTQQQQKGVWDKDMQDYADKQKTIAETEAKTKQLSDLHSQYTDTTKDVTARRQALAQSVKLRQDAGEGIDFNSEMEKNALSPSVWENISGLTGAIGKGVENTAIDAFKGVALPIIGGMQATVNGANEMAHPKSIGGELKGIADTATGAMGSVASSTPVGSGFNAITGAANVQEPMGEAINNNVIQPTKNFIDSAQSSIAPWMEPGLASSITGALVSSVGLGKLSKVTSDIAKNKDVLGSISKENNLPQTSIYEKISGITPQVKQSIIDLPQKLGGEDKAMSLLQSYKNAADKVIANDPNSLGGQTVLGQTLEKAKNDYYMKPLENAVSEVKNIADDLLQNKNELGKKITDIKSSNSPVSISGDAQSEFNSGLSDFNIDRSIIKEPILKENKPSNIILPFGVKSTPVVPTETGKFTYKIKSGKKEAPLSTSEENTLKQTQSILDGLSSDKSKPTTSILENKITELDNLSTSIKNELGQFGNANPVVGLISRVIGKLKENRPTEQLELNKDYSPIAASLKDLEKAPDIDKQQKLYQIMKDNYNILSDEQKATVDKLGIEIDNSKKFEKTIKGADNASKFINSPESIKQSTKDMIEEIRQKSGGSINIDAEADIARYIDKANKVKDILSRGSGDNGVPFKVGANSRGNVTIGIGDVFNHVINWAASKIANPEKAITHIIENKGQLGLLDQAIKGGKWLTATSLISSAMGLNGEQEQDLYNNLSGEGASPSSTYGTQSNQTEETNDGLSPEIKQRILELQNGSYKE